MLLAALVIGQVSWLRDEATTAAATALIVLTTGFLVLATSRMINLQEVGMLTAFAIGSAFLLDVTVTPALLVLTHRRRV